MKLTSLTLFKRLIEEFGYQDWWPIDKKYHKKNSSDPRFEIIVGAILTQNTSWSNVEKALENLKLKSFLDIEKIVKINIKDLRSMIKPTGFFNQKAERIKNIAKYLNNNYNGDLDWFFNRNLKDIRKELLSLNGIGQETADSIILYAGNMPIFVVDTYTKRICKRLSLNTTTEYNKTQQYFEEELNKEYSNKNLTQVYNEYHALIVKLAKIYCKKKPVCKECPLKKNCSYRKNLFK
jgi:endonuclease-3 related protein